MESKKITYQDGYSTLEGYLAYDDSLTSPRPAVLICHDWSGRNEFVEKKAEKLAELGYVGFALDMYGKGLIGKTTEEKSQLMQPFVTDRKLLRQRVSAAYSALKTLPLVDHPKIAVIGFCFGGMCALDLARSGADLKGVVSFHGFFNAPENVSHEIVKAKILAFHGADDPMAPLNQIEPFKKEMSQAKVDWQVHVFGNTMHAFTNPLANDLALGLVYNPVADQRSWLGMKNFLSEIFA